MSTENKKAAEAANTGRENNEVKNEGGHKESEHQLHIFVNRLKFEKKDGVKPIMTVDEIARLVGLTAETATVRRLRGNSDHGEPLSGNVEVKNGDHFTAIRKVVVGGHGSFPRIEAELALLRQSGQDCVYSAQGPEAVIYKDLPVLNSRSPVQTTDALVIVPPGFPAAMLDRVALPSDSPLLGRVKGAVQEEVICNGRSWKLVSYHPHQNGGGGPWNPQVHGFHTYLAEILAWLGDVK